MSNNIKEYIIGNLRYKIYHSKYKKYLRKHIVEQYEWRLKKMQKVCFYNGECAMCGCETTKLQFANKACDKPCYPKMMNAITWLKFKLNNKII